VLNDQKSHNKPIISWFKILPAPNPQPWEPYKIWLPAIFGWWKWCV